MEEKELVEALFRRDDSVLSMLEEQYGPRLRRFARRFLRSREDAEEAVNDTWLNAWNTIPPQKPENLFAYLAKLCRFAALGKVDWNTARKRSATVVELTAELEECIPDRMAERQVESRAIGRALGGFLSALPPEHRTLFLRRYWYGDPIRDIAARSGMGESRVKTTLFRLRKELKNYLEKEGIDL